MVLSGSFPEAMDRVRIEVVRNGDDARLPGILPLFTAMHGEMARQGMAMALAPGGATLWWNGIRPGLERFGRLVVAWQGDVPVGFAHAALKVAPGHLEGGRIGLIAHVYASPEHRRTGIATRMLEPVHAWFTMKKVDSIELQVLALNAPAMAFWKSQGFSVELVQMRRSTEA